MEMINESKEDREKFRKWLIDNGGIISDVADDVTDWYISHRNSMKSPYNDFYYWMNKSNYDEFRKYIDSIKDKEKSKKELSSSEKEGARLVYSDKDWKVYSITNYEASAKYGKGTKWCISGSKRWTSGEYPSRYWDRYESNGVKFYFFIGKNDKYALAIYPDGENFEIYNSADNMIAYIPNAPKVDEITVDYRDSSVINVLQNAFVTNKLPFSIVKSCIDYIYADNESSLIEIFDNAKKFCDSLADNIPDGYLEYEAYKVGKYSREDYIKKFGDDPDEIDEYDFDRPFYAYDSDIYNHTSKDELCSPKTWDDYKYFILYYGEGGDDEETFKEWSEFLYELEKFTYDGIDILLPEYVAKYIIKNDDSIDTSFLSGLGLAKEQLDELKDDIDLDESFRYKLDESKEDIQKFIDKFGKDTYDKFLKAKDRLKKNGMSTDMTYYTSKVSKKELEDTIYSLYSNEKDTQKLRSLKGEERNVRGKYNFLGEHNGYLVYQPLDYMASVDLGINTGWCTTGRYGHYGHPDYKPDLDKAEFHFDEYTDKGVKFYYFLNPSTFYGEYAVALYNRDGVGESDDIYDKETDTLYTVEASNFKLFNARDEDIVYKKKVVDVADELGLGLKYDIEVSRLNDRVKGGFGFFDDGTLRECFDKEAVDIVIPEGVKVIASMAFDGMSSLKSVKFPSTLKEIHHYAFSDCAELSNVDFSLCTSLSYIGRQTFNECVSLKSVEFNSENNFEFDEEVFVNCKNLKRIKLPKYTDEIGEGSFIFTALKEIDIPSSLKTLNSHMFESCRSLERVNNCESIEKFYDYVFQDCPSLKELHISKDALLNISALKEINSDSLVVYTDNESAIEQCKRFGIKYVTSNNNEVESLISDLKKDRKIFEEFKRLGYIEELNNLMKEKSQRKVADKTDSTEEEK